MFTISATFTTSEKKTMKLIVSHCHGKWH